MVSGIIIGSVVLSVAIVVVVLLSLKRSGAFGMSKKQQEQAMNLVQTGAKARAWIMAIQPTGMVVNHINIQCDIYFRLEPLLGGAPIDVSKRVLVSQTAMPQIGAVWPAWYNPSNPQEFAVGQPQAMTPETIATFREFGIATPFDRPAGT